MPSMVKQDRDKYSDFYWWLMYKLPKLPDNKPAVWRAFKRHAGKFAGLAIMWGGSPLIKVDTGRMSECEPDGDPELQPGGWYRQKQKIRWYGFTVPTKGVEEIYVASDLASGAWHKQIEPVLESTVLHELVHWCRKAGGQDVNDEGPPEAFEKEAYGRIVQRDWQTCMNIDYFKVP